MTGFSKFSILVIYYGLSIVNNAVAGPSATSTDHYPDLQNIDFVGDDIVFNSNYQLTKGLWSGWQSPILSNKVKYKKIPFKNKNNCKVPIDALSSLPEVQKRQKIVKCGEDKIWFVTESYCSEGENDQAQLFRYSRQTNKITRIEGAIPKCNGVVDIAVIKNEVWIATNYPGEYGPYSGEGIIRYDLAGEKIKEIVSGKVFSAPLIRAMVISPDNKFLWIVTSKGIDKISLKDKRIESRYFKLEVKSDNDMMFVLDKIEPIDNERWLNFNLLSFPITDVNGFSKAWRNIQGTKKGLLYKHKNVFTFYLQALKYKYKEDNWREHVHQYEFLHLLNNLASYAEPGADFKTFLKNIKIEKIPPIAASQVLKLREKFNIGQAIKNRQVYFNNLVKGYFSGSGSRYRAGGEKQAMCSMAHEDPARLKQIVDLYVANKVSRNIDAGFFYSCFAQRSHFKYGYVAIPALIAAMRGSISVGQGEACWVFSYYSKPRFQTVDAVIPSLYARVRTEQYPSAYQSCKTASYWLANSKEGLQKILDEKYSDPLLAGVAKDVLVEITQENFTSISDYKLWWKTNKSKFKPRNKKYYKN